MLNEPASSLNDDYPQQSNGYPLQPVEAPPEPDTRYVEIRDAVEMVMAIEAEDFSLTDEDKRAQSIFLLPPDSPLLMSFSGRLLMDSETAYARLDSIFAVHDLLPVFRQEGKKQIIHVIQGRVRPASGGGVLSLILFLATVLSVLYVGTIMELNQIAAENPAQVPAILDNLFMNLWRGLPYAVSILLILGAHELGHYFMARKHGTAASLPYFLPFPFGIFGTFGAAIRLREPMRNRKVLIDIGAAGPLAGLVFAIPILLIGLLTSTVGPVGPGMVEGNSILYALSKIIVFGRFLPDGAQDVYVNQMAWAGWTGLLVTGLNLIPVGQLDGGHVLYALLGRRARLFYYPIILALLLLTIFIANELFVFIILILFMGNLHAVPLDDITPLDKRRRNLALFTLGVFFFVFVPAPLTTVTAADIANQNSLIWLSVGLLSLWTWRHRLFKG